MAVVGVTASGKSALALEVARTHPDVELVSVDSMQVYRGMDIGTAKPTAAERAEVRHHLLDVADPWEDHSVARFQSDVRAALADIGRRGRCAVLVGGSGLYLRAVVDDFAIPGRWPDLAGELEADPDTVGLHHRLVRLDPLAASRIEPGNRRRTIRALEVTLGSGRPFSSFGPGLTAHPEQSVPMVGIRLPVSVTAERIADRYTAQVEAGFVAEVARLAASPHPLSRTAAQALGYRELLAHLRGELSLDAALAEAVRRTRRFARRQRAWFGRDPRIAWVDAGDDPSAAHPAARTRVTEALVAQYRREPGAPSVLR